jgi:hypothetical protein
LAASRSPRLDEYLATKAIFHPDFHELTRFDALELGISRANELRQMLQERCSLRREGSSVLDFAKRVAPSILNSGAHAIVPDEVIQSHCAEVRVATVLRHNNTEYATDSAVVTRIALTI